MCGGPNSDFIRLWMNMCCGDVTHVCVGVLSLGLGQWGVTVRAVVFTEVIGSLGVGGDQQLLDVSLLEDKKLINKNLYSYIFYYRAQ